MNKENVKPAVTAHTGARDFYQMSLALKEAGLLTTLVSDFYANKVTSLFFQNLAKKRFCEGLYGSDVTINNKALFGLIKKKITKTKKHNRYIDGIISKNAYEIAKKTDSNLFLYSYYGYDAFAKANKEQWENKKILFQLHPHPEYVKKILLEEIERTPFVKNSIMNEIEFQVNQENYDKLANESLMADFCFVASSFTKKTLIHAGVEERKIKVIPYGVDKAFFVKRERKKKDKVFKIIFVGQMVQRKGIVYLFEAISKLKSKNISIVLCGRGNIDKDIIEKYSHINMKVRINLSKRTLIEELQNSDVMILPSLIEGFAHVVLEAMAAGVPVVTTPNTCGPDVINEGENGFIIPIRDAEFLAKRIENLIDIKNDLFEIGNNAMIKAKQFTWENFKAGIVETYKDVSK